MDGEGGSYLIDETGEKTLVFRTQEKQQEKEKEVENHE